MVGPPLGAGRRGLAVRSQGWLVLVLCVGLALFVVEVALFEVEHRRQKEGGPPPPPRPFAQMVEAAAAAGPLSPFRPTDSPSPVAKRRSTKKRRKRSSKEVPPTRAPWDRTAVAYPFNRPERPVQQSVDREMPSEIRNFVGPLLRRLGLRQTTGMDWAVYIGLQFKAEYEGNYLAAPEGALMSSVPGLKEVLGDKEAFARLWARCVVALGEEPCAWTTAAYNVVHKKNKNKEEEEEETGERRDPRPGGASSSATVMAVEGGGSTFLAAMRREGPSTWIVKPQRRYLSLGMHLAVLSDEDVVDLRSLATWIRREVPAEEAKEAYHTKQPGEFTVQRYVERPATLGRRKFDLRIWVLIASLDPLILYILDVAFPKVSVVDYAGDALPSNTSTLGEKCMHIQMMASEVCAKKMKFPHPFPFDDYPGVTRPDLPLGFKDGTAFFEHLTLRKNHRTAPPAEDYSSSSSSIWELNKTASSAEANWRLWQTDLWPRLVETALSPVLFAKPDLLDHEARIFGRAGNVHARRHRRFALLSPDALYDLDARRWRLEEINTNGLFQLGADEGAGVKTYHVDEGFTEGWLHIVGVDGFPNSPKYDTALQKHLDAFCGASFSDSASTSRPPARLPFSSSSPWS